MSRSSGAAHRQWVRPESPPLSGGVGESVEGSPWVRRWDLRPHCQATDHPDPRRHSRWKDHQSAGVVHNVGAGPGRRGTPGWSAPIALALSAMSIDELHEEVAQAI
jgi:hypothetical protein